MNYLLSPFIYAILHFYKTIFLLFCFPNIIMCILNITSAIKKMAVNELGYIIFENYYKRIGFAKERSYYSSKRLKRKDLLLLATKLIEKIPDPHNAK